MTGEVRRFWTRARLRLIGVLSGTYPFSFSAECRVVVRLHRAGRQSAVWQKEYATTSSSSEVLDLTGNVYKYAAARAVSLLSTVLAETARDVMNDPEFAHALQRQSHGFLRTRIAGGTVTRASEDLDGGR